MSREAPHSSPPQSIYRPCSDRDGARRREAAQWLSTELGDNASKPTLLIVIGLEDGTLLDVLDRHAPDVRVLALEPDGAHARAFLRNPVRAAQLRSGRVTYLAAPDFAGAADAWRLFPASGEGFALLTHPRLQPDVRVASAVETVRSIVFGVRANAKARRRFAPRYLRNAVRNAPAIAAGMDLGAAAGRCAGLPAVITAAGPSLDAALADLPDVARRAVIVATDTTLRPLLGAGVQPHFVVGADPGPANARHFHSLPSCDRTWLVAESALDRSATRPFDGRTLWFRLANHHPWPWLRAHGLDATPLEMWGSVLTAAFEFACLAGCDPIVILGADLAFTGGRPYCRGTTYEFDWAYDVGTGRGLSDVWQAQMTRSDTRLVRDLNDADVRATPSLIAFRDWVLARAARSGRQVFNATGAGLLFGEGVRQLALREAVPQGTIAPRAAELLRGVAGPRGAAPVVARLRDIRRTLDRGMPWADPVSTWAEFSGENFDPAALAAAIDEALADTSEPSAARVLEAGPTAAVGLAESTSRLMAALSGDEAAFARAVQAQARTDVRSCRAGRLDTAQRAAALVEALGLVHGICDETLRLADVPINPSVAGRLDVPVAVSHFWPDALRWRIQLVEAMLGDACGSAAPPGDDVTLNARATGTATQSLLAAPGAGAACARLVLTWSRCAATLYGTATPAGGAQHAFGTALRGWRTWHRRLVLLAGSISTSGRAESLLRVDAHASGRSAAIELPLAASPASLAASLAPAEGAAVDEGFAAGELTALPLTAHMRVHAPRHLAGRASRAVA